MNEQTDPQLLRAYAEHRSEPAFAELVRRHVDFIHSAALRMVCDSHLAQDVTQGVFLALAKNAAQLTERPVLSGWLHRTAQNLAAQTVRTDVRRRVREQEAVTMNELLSAEPDANWESIAPHLDAALGELSEPDRDALLLRYFERKSARDIAQTLGVSEEAAQKRVSRAVERLREFFAKRGVTTGASGLVVVISANAVQVAPVGLAVTISTAAALAGTAAVATGTATATKAIAMTTLQKTLITATLVTAVGTGVYQARQAVTLRDQVHSLTEQQTPLVEKIEQLSRDHDSMTNRLALLAAENARLKNASTELLKLRGEVGLMRNDARNSTQIANDPSVKKALTTKAKDERLRQLLDERPNQRIPELNLLDEQTFLEVAQDANLETEDGIRTALSRLRFIAENQIAGRLQPALQQFAQSNDGHAPESVAQLAALIDPPIDAAILERYEVLNTGTNVAGGWRGGWVISQKTIVDADYDQRWLISPVGFGPSDLKARKQ